MKVLAFASRNICYIASSRIDNKGTTKLFLCDDSGQLENEDFGLYLFIYMESGFFLSHEMPLMTSRPDTKLTGGRPICYFFFFLKTTMKKVQVKGGGDILCREEGEDHPPLFFFFVGRDFFFVFFWEGGNPGPPVVSFLAMANLVIVLSPVLACKEFIKGRKKFQNIQYNLIVYCLF